MATARSEVARDLPRHRWSGEGRPGRAAAALCTPATPRRGPPPRPGLRRPAPTGRLPLQAGGAGDGLHQAINQHQAVPGRDRITQQRPDHGHHLGAQQVRSLLVGEQQGQRDRLGHQERQQAHQARRSRASPDAPATPSQRQPAPKSGHDRGIEGRGRAPTDRQIQLAESEWFTSDPSQPESLRKVTRVTEYTSLESGSLPVDRCGQALHVPRSPNRRAGHEARHVADSRAASLIDHDAPFGRSRSR